MACAAALRVPANNGFTLFELPKQNPNLRKSHRRLAKSPTWSRSLSKYTLFRAFGFEETNRTGIFYTDFKVKLMTYRERSVSP